MTGDDVLRALGPDAEAIVADHEALEHLAQRGYLNGPQPDKIVLDEATEPNADS